MPTGYKIISRWRHLLFKKRLTISFYVIIPLVLGLTAFSSGFIALVLAEHYFFDTNIPFKPIDPSTANQVLRYIRLEVLAFTLLGLLAGVGIAYAILNPLRRIMAGARQIATGDFTGRLDIDHLDELGILGKDFNRMVSSLNRYFIDNMAGGWLLLNREGRIVSVNPGLLNLLGCDADELVGKPLEAISPFLKAGEEFKTLITDAVKKHKVHLNQEMQATLGDDRQTTLSVSTTLLKDKDDLMIGVAATLKDLTRARELADRLQHADKLVSLGGMATSLAHEIRNPLGSIRGLTQLLDEEFEEGQRGHTYTQTMIREIDRLNGVVSNLLNFAHPGSGEPQACQVNEVLDRALLLAKMDLEKKEARVTKHYAVDLPPVFAESRNLIQAFLNLLLNATEALEPGGEIRLHSEFSSPSGDKGGERDYGTVVIKIMNTGKQVDAENRSRIFDPFFTTKKEGTGLGLAITHQIITMNHGKIQLVQEEGYTVFKVEFPAMEQDKDAPENKRNGKADSAKVSNKQLSE